MYVRVCVCMYVFDVVCTVHHPTTRIRTNKTHKILMIRLHFLLDALHVSEYISPSSGANFVNCTSHIPAYTKCDVQLIKAAPNDGLI